MGNLTDALHLEPEVADNLMKVILAYLLLGSYSLLVWQWSAAKSRAKIEGGGLKMAETGAVSGS